MPRVSRIAGTRCDTGPEGRSLPALFGGGVPKPSTPVSRSGWGGGQVRSVGDLSKSAKGFGSSARGMRPRMPVRGSGEVSDAVGIVMFMPKEYHTIGCLSSGKRKRQSACEGWSDNPGGPAGTPCDGPITLRGVCAGCGGFAGCGLSDLGGTGGAGRRLLFRCPRTRFLPPVDSSRCPSYRHHRKTRRNHRPSSPRPCYSPSFTPRTPVGPCCQLTVALNEYPVVFVQFWSAILDLT